MNIIFYPKTHNNADYWASELKTKLINQAESNKMINSGGVLNHVMQL